MIVKDGKIIEITESELYSLYLERGMDDIMSFTGYKYAFEKSGCKIVE